jgi:hypothetical protein
VDEPACPFCGAAIANTETTAPRTVSERMHRSVLAILGPAILVGAAASLDGCGAVAHYGGHFDANVYDDAGTGGDR